MQYKICILEIYLNITKMIAFLFLICVLLVLADTDDFFLSPIIAHDFLRAGCCWLFFGYNSIDKGIKHIVSTSLCF